MGRDVRRGSKKQKLVDEFEDFRNESHYRREKDLASIYANSDFSSRRYPTFAELFKAFYSANSYIPLKSATTQEGLIELNSDS